MSTAKYIVIEGAEGVGKTTMVQMIAGHLQAAGLPVKILREPESQNDLTSRAIRRLTQDPRFPMNTKTEVLLYNAARSQSLEIIKDWVSNGVYCLVDRSYLTTLAIQYYGRGDVTDYDKINDIIDFAVGDMYPDLTVVLDAPVDILKERVKHRYSGDRFDNLDESFLERVRAGYLWEAKQRDLPIVYANEDIQTVFKQVWEHVTKTLAMRDGKPSGKPQSVAEVLTNHPVAKLATAGTQTTISEVMTSLTVPAESGSSIIIEKQSEESTSIKKLDEPLVVKNDNGSFSVTSAGHDWLASAISNPNGNVYATLGRLKGVTAAAAMARLSRRGDDMKITLLDEFSGEAEKDAQLLHRVITAYGDDSVQQLVGQHFVVEGASVLLTKKLERGRLAAYLEQSTRYIYFDQKDEKGHYRFYIPDELHGKTRSKYIKTMNEIFDTYSEMAHTLTEYVRKNSTVPKTEQDGAWRSATKAQACDAIRDTLPLATKVTVGIFASGQATEQLIMRLQSDELLEAQNTGSSLLQEGRKVMPTFLERADKPDRGGAIIAYRAKTRASLKQIANDLLPPNHSAISDSVTLTSFTPRSELSIVADMLYEHSDLPLDQLQQEVDKWRYDKKLAVFESYMGERLNRRHRPGRALEKIHYSFDMTTKYSVFKDLQRHRMVDDLQWQDFSPRLGYDVSKLVEEAGLSDMYEHCFDLSLDLYSAIQAANGPLVAQYAVLQGHNVRWQVTINARQAFQMLELRSSPQGHPAYRRVAKQMHEKILEIHPLIAEAMIFMNSDEDPELSRLAAERYTQFKLEQLQTSERKDIKTKRNI